MEEGFKEKMMTLVEKGKGYRIFKDKLLGIIPFYTLEFTRDGMALRFYFKDKVKEGL